MPTGADVVVRRHLPNTEAFAPLAEGQRRLARFGDIGEGCFIRNAFSSKGYNTRHGARLVIPPPLPTDDRSRHGGMAASSGAPRSGLPV